MKAEKIVRTILIWLPSIVISVFYIANATEKIFQPDKLDKVVANDMTVTIVGIGLLIAVALFLVNKTLIWGTMLLAFYMTLIVFVHMYKGKPFEIAILMVMSTVFATYLRKPGVFHQKQKI